MTSTCRFCREPLTHNFANLGMSPLSNSYLKPEKIKNMEPFFPLHAYVCANCKLVQLEEFESPENIFSDYAYFSSYSESWLDHARRYAEKMVARFSLGSGSKVVEIASNDGYLLQYFKSSGVKVLGIEPAANVAKVAEEKGIPTQVRFFGEQAARELLEDDGCANLIVGNNVLAHVPDLNDFVRGMKVLLAADGVITMEFPHLLRLMQQNQFDTIYHEHFSYFSMHTVERVFLHHGLKVFDVDELATHGGSLRIYACHEGDSSKAISSSVVDVKSSEDDAGLTGLEAYKRFEEQVKMIKRGLLKFLIECKENGKTVVGYGAPAKGNTLLNYCGVRQDFLDFTVDLSPHKQGTFLPGTHIPVYAPDKIMQTRPDYILILPWNLKDEIMTQMSMIREWGGKFVVPIPRLEILS